MAQWFEILCLCLGFAPGLDHGLLAGAEALGQVVHRLSIRQPQLLDDFGHFVGRNPHAEVPLSLSCRISQPLIVAITPALIIAGEKLLERLRPRERRRNVISKARLRAGQTLRFSWP